MICVSIGRSRERHVMAEHKHLAEHGAKLVELRLDYISGDIPVRKLLAERPTPVVATCRRRGDGGKFPGSEDARQQILRTAIAEGVEYIDLEEDVAATIRRYGKTKRIISHHNFRQTPDDLEEIHARLASLDADIVKIAVMANSPHDNLRVLRLVQQAQVPTIGLCMGEMGTPSRILAGKFGSPLTYATFHQERELAPGQLSFEQMKQVYHCDQINKETAVYAVIADPVGHSLSPLIHNAALRHQGINAVYVPFRVPKQDLEQFLRDAPQLGIRGVSVTIPHKEAVIRHLARVDKAVRDIGAANTLVLEGNQLVGYNTDSRAALDSLEPHLPKPNPENPAEHGKALVLGAGGAAMAVAYGLKRRGYDVFVTGRTRERADALAARLGCRALAWVARHSVHCDVLVNCTPIGMHPNLDETPFPKAYLKPSMVVFDAVYNPENTLLVKDARSQGCAVATGVEMFIRQASLQFKLFTGQNAPADLMRETLKKAISAAKH
jgi:3-dehydroquinate dehydratase/shikimate dehydrogenase